MSTICVALVLKTVIDKCQLLDFQFYVRLAIEHFDPDSRLYWQTLVIDIGYRKKHFTR